MNQRYGYAPLPAALPCVMCNVPCDIVKQFPCGCHLPIHAPCVNTFLCQGGVCAKCHQVWVPMDTATVTTAWWDTSSQQDILIQRPSTMQLSCCESSRLLYFYCLCCLFLLIVVCLLAYIVYRLL